MFTGIIQHVGTVRSVRRAVESRVLDVEAPELAPDVALGDSICVSGVCLTATRVNAGRMSFDVSSETLRLTTLGDLNEGSEVNLEPALRVGDRMGGHFVSGHVDGTGVILRRERRPGEERLEVEVPSDLTDLMIMKGSVAVDGISLTIAALRLGAFEVSLIPHTIASTTLRGKRAGDRVNIECDMIGRWVKRLVEGGGPRPAAGVLDVSSLEGEGF